MNTTQWPRQHRILITATFFLNLELSTSLVQEHCTLNLFSSFIYWSGGGNRYWFIDWMVWKNRSVHRRNTTRRRIFGNQRWAHQGKTLKLPFCKRKVFKEKRLSNYQYMFKNSLWKRHRFIFSYLVYKTWCCLLNRNCTRLSNLFLLSFNQFYCPCLDNLYSIKTDKKWYSRPED